MTIKYLAGNRISGLSGDSKPTNVPTNSIFLETDTPALFVFNGTIWIGLGATCTIITDQNIESDENSASQNASRLFHGENLTTSFITYQTKNVTVAEDDTVIVIATAQVCFDTGTGSPPTVDARLTLDSVQVNTEAYNFSTSPKSKMFNLISIIHGESAATYTYDLDLKTNGFGGSTELRLLGTSIRIIVLRA